MLHSSMGPIDDPNYAYTFTSQPAIPVNGYLVACCNGDGISGPKFEIDAHNNIVLNDWDMNDVSSMMVRDGSKFGYLFAMECSGLDGATSHCHTQHTTKLFMNTPETCREGYSLYIAGPDNSTYKSFYFDSTKEISPYGYQVICGNGDSFPFDLYGLKFEINENDSV